MTKLPKNIAATTIVTRGSVNIITKKIALQYLLVCRIVIVILNQVKKRKPLDWSYYNYFDQDHLYGTFELSRMYCKPSAKFWQMWINFALLIVNPGSTMALFTFLLNRIYGVRIQEPDLWSANPGTGSMECESRKQNVYSCY